MTTLESKFIDKLERFANDGRTVCVNSEILKGLISYVRLLEKVSWHADEASPIVAQTCPGKSQSLNNKIAQAIAEAKHVNNLCTTFLKD